MNIYEHYHKIWRYQLLTWWVVLKIKKDVFTFWILSSDWLDQSIWNLLSVLHSQYHACWCTVDFRSQFINRHGIGTQSRNISSPASKELKQDSKLYFWNLHIWDIAFTGCYTPVRYFLLQNISIISLSWPSGTISLEICTCTYSTNDLLIKPSTEPMLTH